MQQGDFEIEIKSIAAFREGDQVEPTPIRQDGEDMTEKLRRKEQQQGERPPSSRKSEADAMISKPFKEADEPKRAERRGPKNPILRFLSSCCGD